MFSLMYHDSEQCLCFHYQSGPLSHDHTQTHAMHTHAYVCMYVCMYVRMYIVHPAEMGTWNFQGANQTGYRSISAVVQVGLRVPTPLAEKR